MFLTLFSLLVAIPLSSTGGTNHWTINAISFKDPTVHFRLDIYSPTTPGSYPVLIYLPGFGGIVPATFYTTMVTAVAEQNVILIGLSKIESVKPEKLAVHISNFLDWVVLPDDGATRLFAEHREVKGVIPNMDRLGFLSHSSGAHGIGQYLNGTCGPLKLLIMMNPVDGIDPFGKVQDFVTHPPNPLPFRIPTLIISDGLDNVPVLKGAPACAPNNMSNDRWYYSLYGPTFNVNLTDYGHADNLDEPYHTASEAVCAPCKGSICNFPQYKNDEATLITSFVRAIFERDLRQLQIIITPHTFLQINVSNKYDFHKYDYTHGGPGGFCTHD